MSSKLITFLLSPSHNKRTVKRSCKLLGTSVLGVDDGRVLRARLPGCPSAKQRDAVACGFIGEVTTMVCTLFSSGERDREITAV